MKGSECNVVRYLNKKHFKVRIFKLGQLIEDNKWITW